jgi:hypothetical protein
MRQRQYTLTPAHVQTHATYRLQKHLRLADHGPKCTADTRWTVLCYAASRIISLAAACAALRDAPSDTAAHGFVVPKRNRRAPGRIRGTAAEGTWRTPQLQ